MTRDWWMHASIAACLILAVPQAAADDLVGILPPSWSGASYDESSNTINITWQPPGNDTYVYHVYRDGSLVADTTQTWHVDEVTWTHAVYYIIAESEDGESPPSMPLLAQNQSSSDPLNLFHIPGFADLGPCGIVGFSIEWEYPFLFWGIHWECLGPIGQMLEHGDPLQTDAETFLE